MKKWPGFYPFGFLRIVPILLIGLLFLGCGPKIREFNQQTAREFLLQTEANMQVVDDYLQTFGHYSGTIWKILEPIKGELPQQLLKSLKELTVLSANCPPMDDPDGECDFEHWKPTLDFEYPFVERKHYEFTTGYSVGCAVVGAYSSLLEMLRRFAPIFPEVAKVLAIIPVLAL